MIVRLGRPEEADVIVALLAAAFHDYVRGLGRDQPGPHDWVPDRLAAGDIAVALGETGDILGICAMSLDLAAGSLTVDILATDPKAQGRGIGRALLAHAETLARDAGARALHLHTVARYDHLLRLYQGVGFRVTHLGPRPKGDDGHPRAFLRKDLDEKETMA